MKKIKILTIILLIIAISMIGFFGIYTKYQNRMTNDVEGYSYADDLTGYRSIKLKISEETDTVIKDKDGKEVSDADSLSDDELKEKGYTKEEVAKNSDDVKNIDNYKKAKKIIEYRLKKLSVDNYLVRLNENNGEIIIEIPENDDTDSIISNIYTRGKFEIVDSETSEVLMTNDDIKSSKAMIGNDPNSSGRIVNIATEFNKEGKEKYKNITNTYVKVKTSEEDDSSDENKDETENEESNEEEKEEEKDKEVTLKIDNTDITTMSFEETDESGILQLSVGQATTDLETLNENIKQANNMATVLDSGAIPLEYEISDNEFIMSELNRDNIHVLKYIGLGILALMLIVFLIRYKLAGLLAGLSNIGLIAILLILIRYGNVELSLTGILAIGIISLLNYLFVNKFLSKIKNSKDDDELEKVKRANKETYIEFFVKMIPIIIMTITFSFISWMSISSFGMVMFWGIFLIAVYNYIITNNLLKIKAK